jgi:hypothetical protein
MVTLSKYVRIKWFTQCLDTFLQFGEFMSVAMALVGLRA